MLLDDPSYHQFLTELKVRIRQARLRAVVAANAHMIQLYWELGREILAKQAAEGWGAKVIDTLSVDLKAAFPDMKGLSPRNLKYMRAFAEAWPDWEIVQGSLAQISWYHHLALLHKVKFIRSRIVTLRFGMPKQPE
jgi:predicted nuclease of restriction endonuclease-like (RecB) superfamily